MADRIIDYIIEQANRYDINNLQFEDDIKYELSRLTDKYHSMVINTAVCDITSLLIMTKQINMIKDIMNEYTSK